MKFSDLFVPRVANSNPEVRKKAVMRTTDTYTLKKVISNDKDPNVREVANKRLRELQS